MALRKIIISMSVLAFSLGIVAIFIHLSLKYENASTQALFQQHAIDQTIELIRVMEHNIQAPLSIASLFSASQHVTKEEFRIFTQPLLKQYPSLQALQWAPIVHHKDRRTFEQSAKKYFKAYKITEKKSNKMVTSSVRDHYVPVFFCEPILSNERAHGYDLASNADRRLMLAYSRDTASSSLSTKLNLVQDRGNKTGILIAHPVYHKNISLGSLQQKRESIKGYSIAVLMLDDVIGNALKRHSKHKIATYITDITNKIRPQVIYGGDIKLSDQQNAHLVSDKIRTAKVKMSKTYQLHNRIWNIQIIPMEGHYTMTASWRIYAVVFLVVFFTLTILLSIKMIKDKANQLSQLVIEKDQEIKQRKIFEKALQLANTKLENMSFKDGLLGIYNRRKFDQYFKQEWQRALRSRIPLSLILIDVDNFKSYNDLYGHVDGDKVLQEIAKAILICANRTTDLVSRYGGDEIVIILPETNIDGAVTIAESIRKTVLFMSIPHTGNDDKNVVSISAGVGCITPKPDMQPSEFVTNVDSALYVAKKNGRNSIANINEDSNDENDHLTMPKHA